MNAQHTNPVPWTREEAAALKRQARYMFTKHDHRTSDRDALTRSNCGACVLSGYATTKEGGHVQPNYAGWARAYIQAGRPIPEAYREAYADDLLEVEEGTDTPTRYALALARDVATFGETFA